MTTQAALAVQTAAARLAADDPLGARHVPCLSAYGRRGDNAFSDRLRMAVWRPASPPPSPVPPAGGLFPQVRALLAPTGWTVERMRFPVWFTDKGWVPLEDAWEQAALGALAAESLPLGAIRKVADIRDEAVVPHACYRVKGPFGEAHVTVEDYCVVAVELERLSLRDATEAVRAAAAIAAARMRADGLGADAAVTLLGLPRYLLSSDGLLARDEVPVGQRFAAPEPSETVALPTGSVCRYRDATSRSELWFGFSADGVPLFEAMGNDGIFAHFSPFPDREALAGRLAADWAASGRVRFASRAVVEVACAAFAADIHFTPCGARPLSDPERRTVPCQDGAAWVRVPAVTCNFSRMPPDVDSTWKLIAADGEPVSFPSRVAGLPGHSVVAALCRGVLVFKDVQELERGLPARAVEALARALRAEIDEGVLARAGLEQAADGSVVPYSGRRVQRAAVDCAFAWERDVDREEVLVLRDHRGAAVMETDLTIGADGLAFRITRGALLRATVDSEDAKLLRKAAAVLQLTPSLGAPASP